jgi:TonB family protein
VRQKVLAHTGAARACYEAEAKGNPDLRGTIIVAWQIDAKGVVTSSLVVRSTLDNPAVETCLLRVVASWAFPPSDAPTTVAAYPFRFGLTH